jgi:epoxyqueuosine reductase QueG
MMNNSDLINKAYEISDKYNVILKGNIKISGNVNCILFAYYCKSTPFYKDFINVFRAVANVNRVSNKNLKEIKKLIKLYGYNKIWAKGVFSFYGDLRPLAVEAGFGKWSESGLIANEKYGTDFLITAIFYK